MPVLPVQTAQALRDKGFEGAVPLVGNEAHRPYDRPPLYKDYLQGKTSRDSIDVHDPGYYRPGRTTHLSDGPSSSCTERKSN